MAADDAAVRARSLRALPHIFSQGLQLAPYKRLGAMISIMAAAEADVFQGLELEDIRALYNYAGRVGFMRRFLVSGSAVSTTGYAGIGDIPAADVSQPCTLLLAGDSGKHVLSATWQPSTGILSLDFQRKVGKPGRTKLMPDETKLPVLRRFRPDVLQALSSGDAVEAYYVLDRLWTAIILAGHIGQSPLSPVVLGMRAQFLHGETVVAAQHDGAHGVSNIGLLLDQVEPLGGIMSPDLLLQRPDGGCSQVPGDEIYNLLPYRL